LGLTIAKKAGFVGARFGRLTVLGKAGLDKWQHLVAECRCDCGKTVAVRWQSLRRGYTRSCGCLMPDLFVKDLTGSRFGKLLVLSRAGSTTAHRTKWLCRCDCGTEVVRHRSSLVAGQTTSCGCAKRREYGEAARNRVLARYKEQALKRSLIWELSDEVALRLFSGRCYYCGSAPSTREYRRTFGDFVYNGIDRVDSSRGYEPGNVVSCCFACNVAKNTRDVQEFLQWARRIAEAHPERVVLRPVEDDRPAKVSDVLRFQGRLIFQVRFSKETAATLL